MVGVLKRWGDILLHFDHFTRHGVHLQEWAKYDVDVLNGTVFCLLFTTWIKSFSLFGLKVANISQHIPSILSFH